MMTVRKAGKAIKNLIQLFQNKKRLSIELGVDDSRKLFYVMSGIQFGCSESDGKLLNKFIELLYSKYGKVDGYGWYKSLDNATGDRTESIDVFINEFISFMKVDRK